MWPAIRNLYRGKVPGKLVRRSEVMGVSTKYRITRRPLLGMLSGVLLKALTNSSTITTFILISLLKSGSITVMQTLPVIIGHNIGGAALVYMASLDIKVFILFLIGITGLLVTSDRAVRLRTAAGAFLGIGLLFLGLNLIRVGGGSMQDEPWFRMLLQRTSDSYGLAFLAGGLLTFLSQSTAAIRPIRPLPPMNG